MTAEQYKSALAKFGLSQERAGQWLGVSPRTSQNWALGTKKGRPVPGPVGKLFRLMLKLGLMPEDVK